MSERAEPKVREFLGQRLRELRREQGLSQERAGAKSRLSGKFIGEVERGEKSISIDSLYRVSIALGVPLRQLTDVTPGRRVVVPPREVEELYALVARRPLAQIRKVLAVVKPLVADEPRRKKRAA